jgi:hypothetical protein
LKRIGRGSKPDTWRMCYGQRISRPLTTKNKEKGGFRLPFFIADLSS